MAIDQLDEFTSGASTYWKNVTGDQRDWTLGHTGGTPSVNTGPSGAETGSYYTYCETSTPVAVNDEFWLQMKATINASTQGPLKITFEEHMAGPAMDTATEAYLILEAFNGSIWVEEYRQTGTNGATGDGLNWQSKEVDLASYSNTDFDLRFKFKVSSTGNAFENDAALDQIRVFTNVGIDAVTPSEFDFDNANVDITGGGFEASQGTGTVYISDVTTLAGGANEVDISGAINTWSDTTINLDFTGMSAAEVTNLHGLGPGARYIIVVTDSSVEYGGETAAITLHRPVAWALKASANIAASGENTTAQLTAPGARTTGDFDGGRIMDDENPGDAVVIAINQYREDEWSIEPVAGSVYGYQYEFRVLYGAAVPDTISVTPTATITAAIGGFFGRPTSSHVRTRNRRM